MRIPRVLLSEVTPGEQKTWSLDRGTRHYLINVLRLKTGRELIVFDGRNERESRALLSSADKKSAEIEILETYPTLRESPLGITLFLGISKGDHMDFAIQKAVELGVNVIQPLLCERAVNGAADDSRLEKKMAHWDSIITSACEQSGRCIKPSILEPVEFRSAVDSNEGRQALILTPSARRGFAQQDKPEGEVTLFIGPEGGFSENETEYACQMGVVPVRLGPRIMRTETAVTAAITSLQLCYGDLGQPID